MKIRNLNKRLLAPENITSVVANDWSALTNQHEFKDTVYENPQYKKLFYTGDFMQFSYRPSVDAIPPERRSKEIIIDPLIIFLGYNNDSIFGISLKHFLFDNNVVGGLRFVEDYIRNYFEIIHDRIIQRKPSYDNPNALSSFWQSILEKAKNQNRITATLTSYVRQYHIKEFKINNMRKVINIEDIRNEMKRAKIIRPEGVRIEDVFYE